jgi:hypothetical protein
MAYMVKQTLEDPQIDYVQIKQTLSEASHKQELYQLIVNSPFDYRVASAHLFLGIVVLLFANRETGNIDRIALSETELAKNTTDVSYVPFNQIKIPLDHPENIIAQAIKTGKHQDTTDWKFLFEPALTAEQARINQASGGIAYSAVYPLLGVKGGGAMIFSYFQYVNNIGPAQHEFMQQYSGLVSSVLENQTA